MSDLARDLGGQFRTTCVQESSGFATAPSDLLEISPNFFTRSSRARENADRKADLLSYAYESTEGR
jgi:hypothetical protein